MMDMCLNLCDSALSTLATEETLLLDSDGEGLVEVGMNVR